MHGIELSCPLQQCLQKQTAMAAAALCRIHRHRGDVQFIGHQPTAGHTQQSFRRNKPDAEPPGIVQLPPPLLGRPQSIEGVLVQRHTGLQPGRIQTQDLRGRCDARSIDS